MPLYMDYHRKVDGLTADAVADAHKRDMQIQARHGVTYLKYWFDEGEGKVFCLVEAPSREAAEAAGARCTNPCGLAKMASPCSLASAPRC